MDKGQTKARHAQHGLRVPWGVRLDLRQPFSPKDLMIPHHAGLVLKPACDGSSVGPNMVANPSFVLPAVEEILRELGPVKTAVKLEQGKMVAPLAFTGSYNATLLGCLEFHGWANTEWNLEFDRRTQTLQARIKITEMHLENIPSLAQGSIVTLVQTAIDSRINPVKILRPDQLSSVVPIAPSGGSLRLRAKEVIPEIVPGSLRLRILYEFLPEK
jgi:hypothetical protein